MGRLQGSSVVDIARIGDRGEVLGRVPLREGNELAVSVGEGGDERPAGRWLAMEEEGTWIGEADPTTSFEARAGAGSGGLGGIGRRGRIEEDEDGLGGGEEASTRGRLLLGVANVGGSLTVLLQIALVAWGVRQLRSMLARRRQRSEAAAAAQRDVATQSSRPVDQVPYAMLSPVAVKRLVELDPVRRFFVDVRCLDAVNGDPAPFEAVLHIPESELNASLQLSEAEWEGRFPSVSKIGRSDLIVFFSTKGHRAQRAANVAADLGYSGCCVLSGGIEAYVAAMSNYVDVPLKFLSRDAVATLLEKHEKSGEVTESGSSSIHLLDVRRHDERALFGHIRGSQNIPVVEFPKALTLENVAWEETYHFPKFAEDDIVIFQCRINGRAAWAAQLAQDTGLKRCFVFKEGIVGWRLDPNVFPHDAYKLDDTPPEPINFEVEKVDYEAARAELQQLGLE